MLIVWLILLRCCGFPSVLSDKKLVFCANKEGNAKILTVNNTTTNRYASVRIEKFSFCNNQRFINIDMLQATSYYQLQQECTGKFGNQYHFVQFASSTDMNSNDNWSAVRLCNSYFVRSHFKVFLETNRVAKNISITRSSWLLDEILYYDQQVCPGGDGTATNNSDFKIWCFGVELTNDSYGYGIAGNYTPTPNPKIVAFKETWLIKFPPKNTKLEFFSAYIPSRNNEENVKNLSKQCVSVGRLEKWPVTTMLAFIPDEIFEFGDVKAYLFRTGGNVHFADGLYSFNIETRGLTFNFRTAHFDEFVSEVLKHRLNYTEQCVIRD